MNGSTLALYVILGGITIAVVYILVTNNKENKLQQQKYK